MDELLDKVLTAVYNPLKQERIEIVKAPRGILMAAAAAVTPIQKRQLPQVVTLERDKSSPTKTGINYYNSLKNLL